MSPRLSSAPSKNRTGSKRPQTQRVLTQRTDQLATLATAGELGLSTLLVLGLGDRFAAAGLFILNAVAVISYPDLSDAGRNQHLSWGLLLAVLLILSRGNMECGCVGAT